jgi:hypothetical protein
VRGGDAQRRSGQWRTISDVYRGPRQYAVLKLPPRETRQTRRWSCRLRGRNLGKRLIYTQRYYLFCATGGGVIEGWFLILFPLLCCCCHANVTPPADLTFHLKNFTHHPLTHDGSGSFASCCASACCPALQRVCLISPIPKPVI